MPGQREEPSNPTQKELDKILREKHIDENDHKIDDKSSPQDTDSKITPAFSSLDEETTYYYLSILTLVLTILMWPAGLILGILCLIKMKRSQKGWPLALASVIIGSIIFIFITLMIIIVTYLI